MIPIRDQLPTRTTPFVTYAILLANVLVFLAQITVQWGGYEEVTRDWGLVPARLLAAPQEDLITVGTSMFMHGGWMHLLGNMLFLWVFGDNVEDALGHIRFGLFYVAGGVAAAIAQIAIDPGSTVPMVGASGAISAVLAGYLSLYPRARVLVLVPIVIVFTFFEFPAWLVIVEWFVLQLLSGMSTLAFGATTGVATFAHIGGFVMGLLLIRPFMLGRTRARYDVWRGWRSERRLRPADVLFRDRYGRRSWRDDGWW
jgi:membrane associated rhomboid family serine protease